MPIDIQDIPNLHGGVSQQSPIHRSPNQVERALNCTFSIDGGAGKRSPLEMIGLLSSQDLGGAFYHWINDKSGAYYLLVIDPTEVSVFRASDGAKLNVTQVGTIGDYLVEDTPVSSFKALTVDSRTFVVNTTRTVTFTDDVSAGSIVGTAQTLQDESLDSVSSGSIYEILGHGSTSFDTHYAKKLNGKWYEWVKPGIADTLDGTTLPHSIELIEDDVDPFGVRVEIQQCTWEQRKVGDEKSNKQPSFVGTKITGIFHSQGRLGLLSPDGVSLSETDEDFNFFRTTVTDVLDTARIDVTVREGKRSPFRWAKPLSKNIVLFTEDSQYFLSGDPIITPGTVRIDLATTYNTSKTCQPVNAGANLYFAAGVGKHTQVREMYIQDNVVTTDTTNVTAHVPKYVPKNVTHMVTHDSLNFLGLYSPEAPESLWTYYSFYSGNEKVQSAWGEWQLPKGCRILNMTIQGNHLLVAFTYSYQETFEGEVITQTYLGRLNLKNNDTEDVPSIFTKPICLDFVVEAAVTPEPENERTLISVPFPIQAIDVLYESQLILGEGHISPGRVYGANTSYTFSPGNAVTQFYVQGTWWDMGKIYIGLKYAQELELSRQYHKANTSMLNSRSQIRNVAIGYLDTASFEVHVKVEGSDEVSGHFITELTNSFHARQLSNEYFRMNSPNLRTSSKRFPVLGQAANTKITLKNNTYVGANWVKAELETLIVSRTRRI